MGGDVKMRIITKAELNNMEALDNVLIVEYNGAVKVAEENYYYYTVSYKDGTTEDVYTVFDMSGCLWRDVKDKLHEYITVDKDNIHEDGECTVDFTDKYGDYSISGRIVDNELLINDKEQLYFNHI